MAGVNDNNELCGIICVNKPVGFTSFDVIAKLRGILKMKRLGHSGTLDPMATGVLPILAGRAAKACDIMPDKDKSYEAGFRLGARSDTQDLTGKVEETKGFSPVPEEKLIETMQNFRGRIVQIPPMYSAVSVGGKRLYELARKGIEIERPARETEIYSLELKEYDENSGTGNISVSCSKGTYIRTLINDIGEALGCGGIMTSLVRTAACGFALEDCVTIDELQRLACEGKISSAVRPIESIFACFPEIRLSGAQERMYRNGIRLSLDKLNCSISSERVRVYGEKGFIGTAVPDAENGVLRVEKNFYID